MSTRSLTYSVIITASLFVFLAAGVLKSDTIRGLDIFANVGIAYTWRPWLTAIVASSTFVLDIEYFALSAVLFFLYTAFRRKWRMLILGILSIGAVVSSSLILKSIFQVERPTTALLSETTLSFPSMHSALAMFLFVIFAHYLWHFYRYKKGTVP